MKQSLSSQIFDKLKTEILLNHLHPGDMICENVLVEQFHVSRTPVRQALQRLENLGLVEIRDGVGTFITMISQQDMKDAYQIRSAAEKIAISTAIYNIKSQEIELLETKLLKFKSQLAKGGYGASFEEMVYTDWKLHDLIISNSDNKLLDDTVEAITLILRRYQFAYISLYTRATEDHLEIIRCIKEKDLNGALIVLDEHLQFRAL